MMFIIGLGTAAPPTRYTQRECWDALCSARQFSQLTPRSRAILKKVLCSDNGIATRHLALDPTLPVFDVRTMEEWVSLKVAHPRFNTWLLGSFSAMALVLALVGIYGVVSYGVTQRTQEIGIRLALGARGRDVAKMVVRQGMKAVLVGVLSGTAVSVALTRFLTAQLYSVTPTDPMTFASVVLVFIGVALAACLVPALRAARVDPIEALRHE